MRYGFADDVTVTVEDEQGTPIVARLFWPEDGDLGPNPWGNRRVRFLEHVLIALYTPPLRSPIRNDPCGSPFFTLNPRQMDASANILKGLTHLKDGRLRLTPGPQPNGYPKRPSRTLTAESVETLRRLFAEEAGYRAARRALRRERVLTKWRTRQAVGVRFRDHQRGRLSPLAAR